MVKAPSLSMITSALLGEKNEADGREGSGLGTSDSNEGYVCQNYDLVVLNLENGHSQFFPPKYVWNRLL